MAIREGLPDSTGRTWSCTAVIARDPVTGDLEGILDITWARTIGSPDALLVVRSLARAAEKELLTRAGQQSALESVRGGQVLSIRKKIGLPEPVALVSRARHQRLPARLRALGRDEAVLEFADRSVRLRPRFAEIVVLLTLHPEGLSSERLGMLLLGDESNLSTVRAEVSRLRGVLGGEILRSRPYRLNLDIVADFLRVRTALRNGRPRAAFRAYGGPLLPSSQAEGIEEERCCLAVELRAAVLCSRDPWLLRRWVETPWGSDDAEAWETLAAGLPRASNASAAAAARAAALYAAS